MLVRCLAREIWLLRREGVVRPRRTSSWCPTPLPASHTVLSAAHDLYLQALHLALPENGRESMAVLHANVAACSLKLRKPAEALEHARAAAQLQPTAVKAWFRQGVALMALGTPAEASAVLDKALSLVQPGTREAAHVKQQLEAARAAAAARQRHLEVQRGMLASHDAWAASRAHNVSTCCIACLHWVCAGCRSGQAQV